jgi:hypothetical protein
MKYGDYGRRDEMNVRRIALGAMILAAAACCGCVGYFHYHPIKSTEQETMAQPGAKLFPGESLGAAGARGVSAAPVSEESLIK